MPKSLFEGGIRVLRTAVIADEQISPTRTRLFAQKINALRVFTRVDILKPATNEEELLKTLRDNNYSLILAPWYQYLGWQKVEAFLGRARTKGPIFAGYFLDDLSAKDIEMIDSAWVRCILVDFKHLSETTVARLCHALIHDDKRTGIRQLLDEKSIVYCETWYSNDRFADRPDLLLGLPEIAKHDWHEHANHARICLRALWDLVYTAGNAKSDLTARAPRAFFQVGVDQNFLLMRLVFSHSAWRGPNAVQYFWPSTQLFGSHAQLLLGYADFFRLHQIGETPEMELVAGLVKRKEPYYSAHDFKTFWIDPIAPDLLTERPTEQLKADRPLERPFPKVALAESAARSGETSSPSGGRTSADVIEEIRLLKIKILSQEDQIRELRSGGLSGNFSPIPPETEDLLQSLELRFTEIRYQISEMEILLAHPGSFSGTADNKVTPMDTPKIRRHLDLLKQREQEWVQTLTKVLAEHQNPALKYLADKRRTGTGG